MHTKPLLLILIFAFALSSCVRSRRPAKNSSSRHTETEQSDRRSIDSRASRGKSVVKMRKADGVYYIPCKINGTEMEFIFDTGASDITMSLTEAKFLYKQGKLTDDDFVGVQQYQIADGSIHEGAVVILRKVELGSRVLKNVQASIVDNPIAPLLLGQSALAKFGKISIDYNKNEIIFE